MKKDKRFQMSLTTEEEREKIIEMLAATMKDLVFAQGTIKARELVRKMFDFNVNDKDIFHITYNIEISGGLLLAFLGKIRRKL